MPDIADNADAGADLIHASEAARIVLVTVRTLARWADAGRVRSFRRDERSGRYYSRAEMERLRPREVTR